MSRQMQLIKRDLDALEDRIRRHPGAAQTQVELLVILTAELAEKVDELSREVDALRKERRQP